MKRMIWITLLIVIATLAHGLDAPLVNMLSLQEGALPLVLPPTYNGWDGENLLDGYPASGWACEEGKIADNTFVFELVAATTFSHFEFDNAAIDTDGSGAKDILVEVSTTSAKTGFVPVLQVALAAKADNQKFPASQAALARWVRLTIKTNQGNDKWTELFDFRGYGPKPPMETPHNISGSYETNWNDFNLRQQGTALGGCYDYSEGLFSGTIEGRVMKMSWTEGDGTRKGPAVFVFAPDGKSFRGFWWTADNAGRAPSGKWDGHKKSDTVGSCAHWSGSVGGELKKKLSSVGRASLYGILFDTDAAVIKTESKPVLEEVLRLLKDEPDWALLVEGHTDSTGNSAHNLTLSQQRAASVKAYLVAGGIAPTRLQSAGFGQSKPVSDNGSELGRAQNRRVELVKK